MQIINLQSQLDVLPETSIKVRAKQVYDRLYETEEDLLPNIVLVEPDDDVSGADYAFVGNRGLLSDLFEEQEPGHPEFSRPYEWASYLPDLKLYEVLLLTSDIDGYWILIPKSVVDAHSDLKWILTHESQGGLSDPQPL